MQTVVDFLLDNKEIPATILLDVTGTTASILKTLEKNEYVEIIEKQIERNPLLNKQIENNDQK